MNLQKPSLAKMLLLHLSGLYRWALELKPDAAAAGTLAEEACREIWKRAAHESTGANLKVWFYSVLWRLSPAEIPAAVPGADRLLASYARLGPECRHPLFLSAGELFSYRELEQVLGILPGSAAVRLREAFRALGAGEVCEQLTGIIQPYVDDELRCEEPAHGKAEAHLRQCPKCAAVYQETKALKHKLHLHLSRPQAPAGLSEKMRRMCEAGKTNIF